jgi:hypothetical protein
MMINVNLLRKCSVVAADGDIGTLDDCLFEDQTWTIRYLVVDTGGWLPGRRVLIHPASVLNTEFSSSKLHLNLSKEKVRNSPDIDSAKPVSRQQESLYHNYYGLEPYWYGPGLWGMYGFPGAYAGAIPAMGPIPVDAEEDAIRREGAELREREAENEADTHLRSAREVIGYHIHATDGDIGHIEDLLVNARSWTIGYVVVGTRNWWPGKKVVVPSARFSKISWAERSITTDLSRDAIKSKREFDSSRLLDEAYEEELFSFYAHENQPGAAQASRTGRAAFTETQGAETGEVALNRIHPAQNRSADKEAQAP